MILTSYNETLSGAGVHREIARNAQVLTGLDVWVGEHFSRLEGKRIGLITNHTGLDRDGKRNIDRMLEAGVKLAAVFSTEHGISGTEDHPDVADVKDALTGIKVWSLYSAKGMRPSDQMLSGIDALVYDIQDIGTRFYTYETTMAYCMEEAARRHIPYYVLDRPSPITGVRVQGPMLERDNFSFIGSCWDCSPFDQ